VKEGQSTDVAVVGCGPAGIAAALQLRRSNIRCLVFERKRVGGLLANAHLVENYPGFPAGISGVELVSLMKQHLDAWSIEVITRNVSSLSHSGTGFEVKAGDEIFRSKILVLATGTQPRMPAAVEIDRAAQGMVLNEVVSILGIRGKEIVVVGAGDAAFDYALNLGRGNRVTILNRTDRIRCLGILKDRAWALPSIDYASDTRVLEVRRISEDMVSIKCRSGGLARELKAHYLIFATGRDPDLGVLSDQVLEAWDRFLEAGLLYLAGDVKGGKRRQTAIAVGDGVQAAVRICDKLREMGR